MPPGSQVATHFTPCSIPNGCVGDEWYAFDVAAAKALLAEAGFPDGFKTTIHLRDVVRGYLAQPVIVAQDIQAQLKANLNIDATIDVQESGTFIDNADAGKLDGIHLLGWGADYPDVTNFLDYHFGAGSSAAVRREVPGHRGAAPGRRAGRLRRDPRAVVRRRQQRDQGQRPDGPDLPRGLRHGLQAPTSRAPTARRSRARCSPS